MRALIDTDILIYEVADRCERTIPWPTETDGEYLWTRHAHWDEAKALLEENIERIVTKLKADEFIGVVTESSQNWRFDFYADYKSNRTSKPQWKPMMVKPLRDWVASQEWGRCIPGLEGDDVMGILQTKPGAGETICVTVDKDLATIPGNHYNFRKDDRYVVTEQEANWMHLLQTLAGDATDGYPGCPGIGMKTAVDLIDAPVEDHEIPWLWDEVIVPAYEAKGLNHEFALSQARCARILRASDYTPQSKSVLPWLPPHYEGYEDE